MINAPELLKPRAPAALEEGVVHVWRGCLDQDPAQRGQLEETLSRDERERAHRFRFERDRARFIVGRGLLRTLLGRYSGIEAARVLFRYGRYGKPSLARGEPPFFNLSHSGATVLYAFSISSELGVDIELVQDGLPGDGIAEQFFSMREVAALRALPEPDREWGFLACWTRKEAIVKARGDGLMVPLDSFDVTLAPGAPARLLDARWGPHEARRWSLLDMSDPNSRHVAALAVPEPGWQCVVHDIDMTVVLDDKEEA